MFYFVFRTWIAFNKHSRSAYAIFACFCSISFTAFDAKADSTRIHAYVPSSGEPAGTHGPPCGQGATTADQIIDIARESLKHTKYGEISEAIGESSWARNRLKVLFGVHRGQSMCKVVCGYVPRSLDFSTTCVDGHVGNSCRETSGDNYVNIDFDYWASASEVAWESVDGGYMTCFLLKNWKHDYGRNFTITLHY